MSSSSSSSSSSSNGYYCCKRRGSGYYKRLCRPRLNILGAFLEAFNYLESCSSSSSSSSSSSYSSSGYPLYCKKCHGGRHSS